MTGPRLGLVACAAGGVEDLRHHLIEPLRAAGWTVAVTLTPTAASWLRESGEIDRIEAATALPVRSEPRLPWEVSPHPPVDCYAVVPATANTVAKLALGIADNQGLTQVGEALGTGHPPVVIFPRVNAAHAAHPAWEAHLATLRRAGAHLVYGDDVWPLHRPRSAPGRRLPWRAIRLAIENAVRS
ncbi:flavoprotein [Jiangella sp. DSM 45060]|uniref:flavoprotein n=1 Tax=Jiangella sp. DSM 45060 TaxID=1798224 RepID=UPI000B81C5E9|nr:flavoprotein [Jiangella sp. DSM 45060]